MRAFKYFEIFLDSVVSEVIGRKGVKSIVTRRNRNELVIIKFNADLWLSRCFFVCVEEDEAFTKLIRYSLN